MLALKLGQSLSSSSGPSGDWSPTDESSLEAWYQNAVGITLNGSDVSQWADSSTNSRNMVQATATEQPSYSAGALTFVAADSNNLQTTGQISLSGDFTIGIRVYMQATGGVLLADNTIANEFFKVTSTTRIAIRIDGVTKQVDLDSGTFLSDTYLVITRASDVISLYFGGVLQSDTETHTGTADIDAIGVRETDTNPLSAIIEEVQIFSSSNATLIANVNTRLASL